MSSDRSIVNSSCAGRRSAGAIRFTSGGRSSRASPWTRWCSSSGFSTIRAIPAGGRRHQPPGGEYRPGAGDREGLGRDAQGADRSARFGPGRRPIRGDDSAQSPRGRCGRVGNRSEPRSHHGRRQANDELAATTETFTLHRHRPAMSLDQAPDNRQPESQPALRPIDCLTLLHEQIKDVGLHLWRNPDSGVAHCTPDADGYCSPRPRP